MNYTPAEPFKIKMVERLRPTTRDERIEILKSAGFNTMMLKSEDIAIDLLTDSGTSAMSDRQWAALMLGDEAYSGSSNFFALEKAVREVYGFKYVVPTHQGRGAEHLVSRSLIKQGMYVLGNLYFPTTRILQELAGGTFVDVSIEDSQEADIDHPFKGNIDISKLENIVAQVGARRVAYINIQTCVNAAGGQPISLANLKEVRNFCTHHGIKIVLDNTRTVENAYLIKRREAGYAERPVADIVREICGIADAVTMSAKKDSLVNIGGFAATNDEELYKKLSGLCIVFEGLQTYGGLAGRDMQAMAVGIRESVDDFHIDWRVSQVERLGQKLDRAGVPMIVPFGGHAIFIDAKRFYSHIAHDAFPAQTLCNALYIEGGIRAGEAGVLSAGRDRKTGDHRYPKLELVRLAIPRRVYTNSHLDFTADVAIAIYDRKKAYRGLRLTFEPQDFRFYGAQFEPI